MSPSASPSASRIAPHSMPLVPPALSPNAAPALRSTEPTPPVADSAAALAARNPRTMPTPWSLSPATESSRPSSASLSLTTLSTSARAARTVPAARSDSGLASTCSWTPLSAAAAATLKTQKSPAMPRRLRSPPTGAEAMSSMTSTVRQSTPSPRSRSWGGIEVQDVTGAVAVAEQDPGTAVEDLGHPVGLLGGGRGEHVADHGTVGQPRFHYPTEGRVVTRAATDDEAHLAVSRLAHPHDAGRSRHPLDVAGIRGDEPVGHLVLERRGSLKIRVIGRPLCVTRGPPPSPT
jgi:hypothetical protein